MNEWRCCASQGLLCTWWNECILAANGDRWLFRLSIGQMTFWLSHGQMWLAMQTNGPAVHVCEEWQWIHDDLIWSAFHGAPGFFCSRQLIIIVIFIIIIVRFLHCCITSPQLPFPEPLLGPLPLATSTKIPLPRQDLGQQFCHDQECLTHLLWCPGVQVMQF